MFRPAGAAEEVWHRVDIAVADPHREVDCGVPVGETTRTKSLTSGHYLTRAYLDVLQIGNRRSQAVAVIDGDGEHPRHRAGEADRPRCCRKHRGAESSL